VDGKGEVITRRDGTNGKGWIEKKISMRQASIPPS